PSLSPFLSPLLLSSPLLSSSLPSLLSPCTPGFSLPLSLSLSLSLCLSLSLVFSCAPFLQTVSSHTHSPCSIVFPHYFILLSRYLSPPSFSLSSLSLFCLPLCFIHSLP